MFLISSTREQSLRLKNAFETEMSHFEAGAFVTFEGWVRDHNEGKKVASLEYEIYERLALKEASQIIEEAKKSYDVLEVRGFHRQGHLDIGDMAVWVGVTAKHRDSAFRACRYVIDEIKLRLPVWKKEHYVDTEAQWVNCQGCYHHHSVDLQEADYYEKQIKLAQVGRGGQERLKAAKVLVVGAGGLGCPALTYLASAGVGRITVCDSDRLEASNLHRQTLYSHADVGLYKAKLAQRKLQEMNPFVHVHAQCERLTVKNAREWIEEHDLILDCTDNFKTKFLIHDTCFLSKKPLVQASIYQYEGQLQFFDFSDREADAFAKESCLRCIWPNEPEEGCVGTCVDSGVIGAVPGVLGTMQAMEAIKYFLQMEGLTKSKMILVDLLSWQVSHLRRKKSPSCPLCSSNSYISTENLFSTEDSAESWEIHLADLTSEEAKKYVWVDIREDSERNVNLPWERDLKHIPSGEMDRFKELDSNRPHLLVCQRGARSERLVKALRQSGHNQFFSLSQGISSVRNHWGRMEGCLNL